MSTPDQGGRGEVSNSSSQLELLPSRNCRLQTSPAPNNLGNSSSPRPPVRLGGASPSGGLKGVSPRPPTPPQPLRHFLFSIYTSLHTSFQEHYIQPIIHFLYKLSIVFVSHSTLYMSVLAAKLYIISNLHINCFE